MNRECGSSQASEEKNKRNNIIKQDLISSGEIYWTGGHFSLLFVCRLQLAASREFISHFAQYFVVNSFFKVGRPK